MEKNIIFRNSQHSGLWPNTIRLEWKVDLSDFECGVVVANQTGGSEYFANCWCTGIFHAQSSLGFAKKKKNARDSSLSENNQQMLVDSRETGTSKSSKDHLNSVCWPLRGSRRRLGGLGLTSVSSEQETDNYCPDWWFMSSAETGGVANWHKRRYAMHQSICESVVQDAADGAMMWGRFCLFSHNILSSVDDHVPLWSQWTHLSDCSFLNVNA